MTETDAERIDRLGLNETLSALEALWGTRTMYYIQDERTGFLAGCNYDPLDTFDAVWHAFDDVSIAHMYMQHGFTPHQAFLLAYSRQAQKNLWNGTSDLDQVHEVLSGSLQKSLLTRILLVAESPEEARELIQRCNGIGPDGHFHDHTAPLADVEARAALLPDPIDTCNCEH